MVGAVREVLFVALLRGINVGGNRKVDMGQLRETFERAGQADVRTYINSGNVIFRTASKDPVRLRAELEAAIESEFGFPVKVVLRDQGRMRALVDSLPETWANDGDTKCDVLFLGEEIDGPEVLDLLPPHDPENEDVRYAEGAVVWRVDRSYATRSSLLKVIGTDLYAQMTVRNCNTLRKLAALMQ